MKRAWFVLLIAGFMVAASVAQASLVMSVTASQDTFVRSDSPNDAFGEADTLLVGGHASVGPFHSFYKFSVDLTGLQPTDDILDVTLRLTSIAEAGAGTVDINLYQLSAANSDWVEGVSGSASVGATYNNKAGPAAPAAWAGGNNVAGFVAGTDYVDTVLGNYSGAANSGTGGETFDFGNAAFTSLIQNNIGSTLELNLVLIDQTDETNFLRIASKENATFDGPELIIDYIPEPGSFLLLTIGFLGVGFFRRLNR